jgi:hypothetical protein
MTSSTTSLPVAEQLEVHRGFLRGVAYRMLGVLADADDVVQDAFVRALRHPPADLSRPLRPWLVRVTVNLARDRLRRRRTVMHALLTDDVALATSLLRADVVAVGDGGGVYAAAVVPVSGRERVVALLFGVRRFWPEATSSFAPCVINGAPALLMWRTDVVAPPIAPRAALCIDVDDDGAIRHVYSVLAPDKLAALPWALVQPPP